MDGVNRPHGLGLWVLGEKEYFEMSVALLVGGLVAVGYGFSRLREKKNNKPQVQKLFR